MNVTDITLFTAVVLLWAAIGMVFIDLRAFRKDYRAFLVSKSADNLGTAMNALGKRVTRIESSDIGQRNSILYIEDRLVVLEAAMIADCEDCEDDEGEAADVEAMGTPGDIRGTGDDPADVLADPQRFDGGTGLVDVSRVQRIGTAADGASSPVIHCTDPFLGEIHREFTDRSEAMIHAAMTGHKLSFS